MGLFDHEVAASWEELLILGGVTPTLFPLSSKTGLPTGKWGNLSPGEQIPADTPDQGYGIACGRRSNGLVVIDVDVKRNAQGAESLIQLQDKWGALPPTLTISTPSGGRHLYFTHPGEFQSNASKIAPGLDVRAEGGYVRIAGSPGGYLLACAIRPTMLPPSWADHLPRYDAPAPASSFEPVDVPDLAETARGRHGAVWVAWRKISKGERFITIPFDGVVDDHLYRLFLELAKIEPWAHVPSIISTIAPSLSILQADDLRAGNSAYTDAQIDRLWTRAAVHVRGQAVPTAPPPASTPWLLLYNGAGFVRRVGELTAYRGPKISRDIWLTARDEWAEEGPTVEVPTKNGDLRPMNQTELAAAYGAAVDLVVMDVSAQSARLEDEGETLILPSTPVALEPHLHSDVDAWLRSYDPEGYVQDWIACIVDLAYAAPALWLTGASGVGKSLLGVGLAQIWASAPTSMRAAFADFNSDVLRCPLIVAEEELPANRRGFPDVERLKDLITETRRSVNEKHKPLIEARGALRIILTSNNLGLIRNAPSLTTDDAQALAERFIHHHVPDERAGAVQATLPLGGVVQAEWINAGRLAEHALYLAKTRSVPFGPRLRLPPRAEALARLFRTQTSSSDSVAQAVYLLILQLARASSPLPSLWRDGTLWTTASTVHARVELTDKVKAPSRRAIGQALRLISLRDRKTIKSRKYWGVDLDVVRGWADSSAYGDTDELESAIQTLDARSGPC